MSNKTSIRSILGAWATAFVVVSCAPKPQVDKTENFAREEDPVIEANSIDEDLTKLSNIELLQRALNWAEGQTTEELLIDFFHGWSEESISNSWTQAKHRVLLAKLTDQVGEAEALRTFEEERSKLFFASAKSGLKTNEFKQYQILSTYPYIKRAAQRDPNLAVEKSTQLVIHPNDRDTLYQEIAFEYSQTNYQAALDFVSERTDINQYEIVPEILQQWILDDSASALEHILDMPESGWRNHLLEKSIVSLALDSPRSALDTALALPQNAGINQVIETVVENIILKDPGIALTELQALKTQSPTIVNAAIKALTRTNTQFAAKYLQTLDPKNVNSDHIYFIGRSFAQEDIIQALNWVQTWSPEEFKSRGIYGILMIMARRDPDSMSRYMNHLHEFGLGSDLAFHVIVEFSEHHPEAALETANSLPDSPMSATLFKIAAGKYIEERPNDFHDVLGMVSDATYKTQATDGLMRAWARADFDSATRWIKTLRSDQLSEQMLSNVVYQWIERDTMDALDYAESIQDRALQSVILTTYFSKKGHLEPEAVIAYANSVDLTPSESVSLASLFHKLGRNDPQRALSALSKIRDSRARDTAINHLTPILSSLSIQATGEWLTTIDMDPANGKISSTIRSYLNRANSDGLFNWFNAISDDDIKEKARLPVARAIAPREPGAAANLINNASKDSIPISSISRIVSGIPTSENKMTFINSLYISPQKRAELLKNN